MTISNFATLIRHDISWESSVSRPFSWNIIPYFFPKIRKDVAKFVVYCSSWLALLGILLNSFLASSDFCSLLKTFLNSLDPDQDGQCSWKIFKLLLKKVSRHRRKPEILPSMLKLKCQSWGKYTTKLGEIFFWFSRKIWLEMSCEFIFCLQTI